MISLAHMGPQTLRLGFVFADGLSSICYPTKFEALLGELLELRASDLSEPEDQWRKDVRDILRNGRFKPTGRGKPASEYLLGAARKDTFPRINAFVDVCNYISLNYLLPISVWDVDRSGGTDFLVRLGEAGESYVFNQSGQQIDLEDLVVGCRSAESDHAEPANRDGTPIVNPVKDSALTKTLDSSSRVAALIYAPELSIAGSHRLLDATQEFEQLFAQCGSDVRSTCGLLDPGARAEFRLSGSVD